MSSLLTNQYAIMVVVMKWLQWALAFQKQKQKELNTS
jgi:hypothetical protein